MDEKPVSEYWNMPPPLSLVTSDIFALFMKMAGGAT